MVRVVFVVNVEVLRENEFHVVARVELREPVWYSDRVMRQAVREQHRELWERELRGRSWDMTVVEWND